MRIRPPPRRRWTKIALALLLLGGTSCPTFASKRIRKDNDPYARRFRVRNLSAFPLEVYWMNMLTEERRLQFELVPGASDTLNSHVVHEFEIKEKPNQKGECGGKKGKCRKRHFQISEDEDQVFTVDKDFKVTVSNSRTIAEERARNALASCRQIEEYVNEATTTNTPLEQLDQLAECMAENVQKSLYEIQEEIDFQAGIRRRMGSRLKDYACADPDYPTTKPIESQEWNPNNPRLLMDDQSHTVHLLLKSDTTMIATIENIVRPWDCQFVQEGSSPQPPEQPEGAPQVPWEARKNPAFLDFLSRIYAYVDPAVKLIDMNARLPQKGETLFEFHEDSAAPPHRSVRNFISDWPVEEPNFARLIMFCEVPEEGGAIHFPESGVHVNPKVGEGLLITYAKQSTNQGFLEQFSNEHMDCPVLKGKRSIVQHQFRLFP